MHWFGGSIAEAVNLSKQKNAIFVVFIEGDNDLSSEMATTIDDSVVVKRLSDESNFLAIKLKSGTTNYTHFAQIYQFVPVPSLFFIGRNGTPLEVVCAGVQPANLASRIDRILEEHHKEKPVQNVQPSTVQPSTSSQSLKEPSPPQTSAKTPTGPEASKDTPETSEPAAKIQKTHHESKSGQQYSVVCDGDVCVRQPVTDRAGPSPGPSHVTGTSGTAKAPEPVLSEVGIEDKLEKAKELIEAKRREKAAQEKELEKQKELERRSTGQGVAELKRWQAEQEMKQIQEERKREKKENDLARQRILEQIAQDRAERRARDSTAQPVPATANQQTTPLQTNMAATSGDSVQARIQFKLPDGSSHTAHFPGAGRLRELTRYIAQHLQVSTSQISLWTAFPRRELVEEDSTLRELQLAPSAALLVQTRRVTAPVQRTTSIANLIAFFSQFITSFFLQPTQQLYTWFRSRVFPPASPPRPSPSPPRDSPPQNLRKRGNIHRLQGERPGEDDNNTWNGNSTQQM